MKKFKEKGFTLIELIAVLVIMAILALIVTPLVMSIIRKARISADKRSIDAYGRSIELAIAGYLLDNGKFPTEVSQLTIEYSGNEVECETTQLNSDSSVYLAGCTVNGRSVEEYTYGKEETVSYKAYSIGDEVTYNNVDYYVIKDSAASDSTLTLLKAEPLSVAEVNQFGGVGTANNHVNKYTSFSVAEAHDRNGYGAMAYYTSETCGKVNGSWVDTGCKNNYESSDIKYVVDAWKNEKASLASEARLISKDEYLEYCLEEEYQYNITDIRTRYVPKYDWMYNSNYWYWLGTQYTDSTSRVWIVGNTGEISYSSTSDLGGYDNQGGVVRPVIVLPKSAL